MEEVAFTFQFFVLVSDLALLPMQGKCLRVRRSWKREEPILAVSRNVPSASPAPLPLEAWVKCFVLSGEQNAGVKEARACKLRGLESPFHAPILTSTILGVSTHATLFHPPHKPAACALLLLPHSCGPGGSKCETTAPRSPEPRWKPVSAPWRQTFRWCLQETDGCTSFWGI